MEQLQEIYCRYTEELNKVQKAASPLAGIFGTGGGPKDHPCHTVFYESVGSWVDSFLAAQPDEDSVAEAARYILIAGAAHKDQPTYWYCFAAQAHAKALIPLLSQAKCQALQQEYSSLYPDSAYLPLSREVYALLCTHSGSALLKKSRFSFRRR